MYDITKEHYGVKKWSDLFSNAFFSRRQNKSNGH